MITISAAFMGAMTVVIIFFVAGKMKKYCKKSAKIKNSKDRKSILVKSEPPKLTSKVPYLETNTPVSTNGLALNTLETILEVDRAIAENSTSLNRNANLSHERKRTRFADEIIIEN